MIKELKFRHQIGSHHIVFDRSHTPAEMALLMSF
jgi:hypothetical protein